MKNETGEATKKSNAEIYAEIVKPGTLFSLYDKDYFTLGLDQDFTIYYCEKGATTLEIKQMSYDEAFQAVEKGVCLPKVDEDYILVDEGLLKENELIQYQKLKDAMDEIVRTYSLDFYYIISKTNKTHLKELAKSCEMSYRNFRFTLTRFMTSGMKYYSLLSRRSAVFGELRKRNKPYTYTKKTGRKVKDRHGNLIEQGIVLDENIKEEILAYSDLIAQGLSYSQAFDRYNAKWHVKPDAFQNGNFLLEDIDKRPTLRQFTHLISKNLEQKEKIMKQKGYLGYYNDHRPLTGDTMTGTSHPGDIVEIDAWEADVSLVSESNPKDSIGRPTLYLMVDRFTRMIVAYYVGLEVNSYQGLSSLFVNLCEDKEDLFKRYGFKNIERSKIPLPEAFIPNTVVTDNGSDFKSDDFRHALSALNIEHQIAPPRSGSAKGLVERTFGEFAHDHKDIFKGAGLIKKEYGSKHHEEAKLTISEYTRLIILAIIKHNMTTMTSYPIHDMDLLNKDVNLSPISLWNFFTKEKMLNPKALNDKADFFFSIMKKIKVTLNRFGIVFEGLVYDLGSDVKLHELQEEEKTSHLDFRLDPRDVSRLYYLDSGKIRWYELSKTKASNNPYFGVSYSEFKKIKAQIRDKNRAAAENNENIKATAKIVTDYMVDEAVEDKKQYGNEKNNVKNMRENRREEKYELARKEKIANYLDDDADNEDIIEQEDFLNINNASYDDFLESMI